MTVGYTEIPSSGLGQQRSKSGADARDCQIRCTANVMLGSKAGTQAVRTHVGACKNPETEARDSRQPLSELSGQVTPLVTRAEAVTTANGVDRLPRGDSRRGARPLSERDICG